MTELEIAIERRCGHREHVCLELPPTLTATDLEQERHWLAAQPCSLCEDAEEFFCPTCSNEECIPNPAWEAWAEYLDAVEEYEDRSSARDILCRRPGIPVPPEPAKWLPCPACRAHG